MTERQAIRRHLERAIGEGPFEGSFVPLDHGSQDVTSASHAWKITAAGQDYDALDLAREVVRIWEKFLKAKGLL